MGDYRYNFSTVYERVDGKSVAVFKRTLHEPGCRFAKNASDLYGSIAEQHEQNGGRLITNPEEWPPYSRFAGCKVCGTDTLFEEAPMHDIKVGETLLNGAVVVACTKTTDVDWVILAVRENLNAPYATWGGHFAEDGQFNTFWGHYHSSITSAIEDYRERGGR